MTANDAGKITFLLPGAEEWLPIKTGISEEGKKTTSKSKEQLNQQFLSSMQMQNLIVLAGCGTSQGSVGGPSMKDLWNKCTKDNGEYTDEANKIIAKTLYENSNDDKVNIEELLSLCEAHLEINEDVEIRTFVENCKEKIIDACSFSKTDSNLTGHKTFIHRLSRRRVRDSRLKLFTTNYDTCFEEAAGSHEIVIIDGFSFSKPRIYGTKFFDYDIVRRMNHSATTDNYLEGVFHLYKLHGSINWEKQDEIIYEKNATPKGACMIFPAKGKYQQSYIQHHLELMARYLAALREPNTCLLIVGFGFNDNHLSEPIMSALKSNPYLKVLVADCNAENNLENSNSYWGKLNSYHQNGEDVTFINATFEEFASLIPDLRSLTPAEKVASSLKSIMGDK